VAAAPAAFSTGGLGFILPPDPFATPQAAALATPPSFVPAAVVPGAQAPAKPTGGSNTLAIWIFAILPVVQAAAIWALFGLLSVGTDLLLRGALLAAPVVINLLLAAIDRRVLRRRGFAKVAPTVLALIPFVYLLVRTIRVGAGGIAPFLGWLLLQTVSYAFILLQLPTIFALVPLSSDTVVAPVVASGPITAAERAAQLTPTGMAAALTSQTLAKNLHFADITCPTIPATVDGTAVTCVGSLASVRMNLNVVVDSSLPNSAFALVSEAPAA
jgi:hypothetical protein